MKSRQENFMRMARAVTETTRKHQDTWSGIPRFSDYAAQLYDIMEQIGSMQAKSELNSTGATLDKSAAREHAIHLGQNLSRRAMAYAEDQNLHQLRNQLKIKRHDLVSGHASEALHKLRDVEEQLEGVLLQLADYGVSAAQLQEFTAAIGDYEKLIEHPRNTIVERKTSNEYIDDYVGALRRLLLKMDHMVNNFEGTPFEREYHNARIIVDLGTRHKHPGKDEHKEGKVS